MMTRIALAVGLTLAALAAVTALTSNDNAMACDSGDPSCNG